MSIDISCWLAIFYLLRASYDMPNWLLEDQYFAVSLSCQSHI